jgi:hypothetical protein
MKEKVFKITSKENVLLFLYFGIGFFEIIAEYYNNTTFMYVLKPLLVPILALLYWIKSKEKNIHFLFSLFFVLLANIFFISKDFYSIVIASVFLITYRGLIIYVVMKRVIINSFLPVFLGSIPFGVLFGYLTFLTMNELGKGLYIYFVQILFLSFLGGLSLSNYMIEESKKNFWLLVHVVLFAFIQFILVLKLYYLSIIIFQPISMGFYIIAQFGIYKFMILSEVKSTKE